MSARQDENREQVHGAPQWLEWLIAAIYVGGLFAASIIAAIASAR